MGKNYRSMEERDRWLSGERYDDLWWKLISAENSEASEILRRLKGQIVLDFGSGKHTKEFEFFLKNFGAVEYIAIDQDPPASTSILSGETISGDLLATAKKLKPSAGYSIAMNGINEELVSADSEYGQELADEVVRLLHPSGLLFGVSNRGILDKIRQKPEMDGAFMRIPGSPDGSENQYYLISKKSD